MAGGTIFAIQKSNLFITFSERKRVTLLRKKANESFVSKVTLSNLMIESFDKTYDFSMTVLNK